MARTNHSTVSLCAAALAIASVFAFVGIVDVSSTDATVVSEMSKQQVIDIELDELAVTISRKETFALEKLPASVLALNGKRVRIRGYVSPHGLTHKDQNFTNFILNVEISVERAMDDLRAGFSGIPMHYDFRVKLQDGHATTLRAEPIVVEGILQIRPDIRYGQFQSLYCIDKATWRPAKPRDEFQRSFSLKC